MTVIRHENGGLFVDCTVGLGGHARAMLEAGATRVIGLDRDPAALAIAAQTLAGFEDRVELVHSDYRAIDSVLEARGIRTIDGALADLGMSSYQLEAEGRGFSFQREDPLDMRMDTTSGPTAAELLGTASETEIADAIFRFGEERFSRRVARAIVQNRETAPIRSTGQLATIVRHAIPRHGFSRIDPATRTFQGLRIWVNRELERLDDFIAAVAARLKTGARMVVITFHSLEDRIVKHTLRALAQREDAQIRILTKKPVLPQPDEVERNPRARSAKLRAAERVA
jgi:16S rRNA (cytosine1402-N4)-methyltransferase